MMEDGLYQDKNNETWFFYIEKPNMWEWDDHYNKWVLWKWNDDDTLVRRLEGRGFESLRLSSPLEFVLFVGRSFEKPDIELWSKHGK